MLHPQIKNTELQSIPSYHILATIPEDPPELDEVC